MSGDQNIVIPEHILKCALANQHEAHPRDAKILSSDVSAGTKKGDNYCSFLSRVVVESEIRGQTHRDSLIVKSYPKADYWLEMLKQGCMFRIEVISYQDVFPKLNRLAEKEGLGPIALPKCFFGDTEEGFLVLQDLKEEGFTVEDKVKGARVFITLSKHKSEQQSIPGLDLPHMKIVLDELAKLHALSYHWIENYFGGLERFKKDYWILNGEGYVLSENGKFEELVDQMDATIFNMLAKVLEFHSNDDDLKERFKAFAKVRKSVVDPIHAPKGKFNCLIHNDAWCNNFMFRNAADGTPIDFRFIDLQLCRRARPTVDLAYCFGSSLTPAMREKHTEELLAYYHDSLTSLLTRLGYKEDLYTFSDLMDDYKECFAFGFTVAGMFSQIQLTDPYAEGNLDIDAMTSEEATQQSIERLIDFQNEQARSNKKLSDRMLQLVEEARRMNVI